MDNDDPPFTPREREWLESRIEEAVASALSELIIENGEVVQDDDSETCSCGREKVHQMGSREPVCPVCDL